MTMRSLIVLAAFLGMAAAYPSNLPCDQSPRGGDRLMDAQIVQGTDTAQFTRGTEILACGTTVKACENLGVSWERPQANMRYLVSSKTTAGTAATGSNLGSSTCDGRSTTQASWTIPKIGGEMELYVTYALNRANVKQTIACKYPIDSSDTSICIDPPTTTPEPSSASSMGVSSIVAALAALAAAVMAIRFR
eukprot:CAMPEP_0173419424 /NCGR_PEP_ID=MMETSP1357-20121228/1273_1 /TAXON_ID=77926 /ORGANISM="Hemiselmis rufescens, Strain PCC563" /LENGTH=191 /DNA_ID=CAMNT_0014382065 /DNA_START=13 /DNA_END=588 /DNA_ORIENTATION=-